MDVAEDPLEALWDIESIYHDLEPARAEVVRAARAKGASFTDIGKILNITRQRAHQLFRD
ncbi:hypothetical protein LSI54_12795 [Nesterenkonia sp. AY15]|uniref:hypothetical protein n=1 Tax=Nesterenkonia sp. AY15 TaxID=2901139 RepID=UPI001F4CE184|nr:hypothetical protein [Nesterenkonia sp. AY15]MCH8572226.1 hypothetical protein [Nesterenkonia sp. AY15]